MGILDSNLFGFKSKTLTESAKAVSNNYVTAGLVDVKGYNTAILTISGITSSGYVKSVGSAINGNRHNCYNVRTATDKDSALINEITTDGDFVVDLTDVNYWGLHTSGSGTYNFTITLTNKIPSTQNNSIIKRTASISNSVGNFLNIDKIGYEFKTICIDVKVTNDNPFAISFYRRRSDGTGLEDIGVLRDIEGNLCNTIVNSGLYFADISGIDYVRLRSDVENSATGTVSCVLLKETMPVDYRPIQLVSSYTKSFEDGESTFYVRFSENNNIIKYFKFIRMELVYAGTPIPNYDISIASYYGPSNFGPFTNIYSLTSKSANTDWIQTTSGSFILKIQPQGSFVPENGNTLEIKLYGMR